MMSRTRSPKSEKIAMETLNFTAVIITQNLKTSENQDTKLCVNALEQDPNFVTGHEIRHFQLPPILTNSRINILLVFMGLNNRYSIRNFEKESFCFTYVTFFLYVCVLDK